MPRLHWQQQRETDCHRLFVKNNTTKKDIIRMMWYLKLKDTVHSLIFHTNNIEPIQPFLWKLSTQKTLCKFITYASCCLSYGHFTPAGNFINKKTIIMSSSYETFSSICSELLHMRVIIKIVTSIKRLLAYFCTLPD